MNTDQRLKKLLDASPEQLGVIDGILEGRVQQEFRCAAGPLLMGMSASAKFLGVSRATLWRMIKTGRLEKVEVLHGSFRLRRADLEGIAAGRRLCPGEAAPNGPDPRRRPCTNPQRDPALVAA
jgi:excisionase family DNA binding protein